MVSGVTLKFCGITNLKDYEKAASLNADFAGFIFYPPSKRFISADHVPFTSEKVKQIKRTGVFVNETADHINQVIKKAGLDAVQLHGEEPPLLLDHLDVSLKIKAFRFRNLKEISLMEEYTNADYFLLDTWDPSKYGGTGRESNFEIINAFVKKAVGLGKKYLIAGGMNPQNIARFIKLNITGFDISSGVEISPGQKDHQKMSLVADLVRRNAVTQTHD